MENVDVEFVDSKGWDNKAALVGSDVILDVIDSTTKDAKVFVTTTKDGNFFISK